MVATQAAPACALAKAKRRLPQRRYSLQTGSTGKTRMVVRVASVGR
jgi:hypothetical protein